MEFSWKDEKYVLVSFYAVLELLSFIQAIRISRAKSRNESLFFELRVRLQYFLYFGVTARLITMAIPTNIYLELLPKYIWLQVVLDLLPEVLFWLSYVLLVMLWAAMYYGSMSNSHDTFIKIAFYVIQGLTFGSVGVTAMTLQFMQKYNTIVEAVYLFILSLCTVGAFTVYGSLLYLRAKSLNVNVKNKDSMLHKLKWIAVIVCTCNTSHSLYLITVDTLSQEDNEWHGFALIWFFYFILTEVTPASIILYIFRKMPESQGYAAIKDPPKRINTGSTGNTN